MFRPGRVAVLRLQRRTAASGCRGPHKQLLELIGGGAGGAGGGGVAAAADAKLDEQEVCFNLGRMHAFLQAQHGFCEEYRPLAAAPGGDAAAPRGPRWVELPAKPAEGKAARNAARAPRLIGLDVEMVINRRTGEKVPIKGALVEAVLSEGRFVRKSDSWLINPMVRLNVADYHWKEQTHGISFDSYMSQIRSAVPLPDVQQELLELLQLPMTSLVGHMLVNDLRALRIFSPSIADRVIDTAFYCGFRDDGGAESLADLSARLLGEAAFRAPGAKVAHDPLADADVGTCIVEGELRRLAAGGAMPSVTFPQSGEGRSVFLIAERDVKALIGPRGAYVKKVKNETGATVTVCTTVRPTPSHYYVVVKSTGLAKHSDAVRMIHDILPGKLVQS